MKTLIVFLLLLGIHMNAYSQLEPYQWRIGVSGGYTNYYGDLSPYPISSLDDYRNFFRLFNYNENYIHDYSYALSLERKLSASLSLQVSAGKYSISMSDRYINPNNNLQMEAPNFNRALNFKTEILDYGVALVLRTDNGKLLNKDAFMAPYLTLGMGWLNFQVFGDLYDQRNIFYNYYSVDPVNDGVFETRLDKLYTELPEGYSDNSFFGNIGLGLRFRLGKQFELFAQSDFKHAYTDYLDDVSGLYRDRYDTPEQQYAARPGVVAIDWGNPVRGNNDGRKDWYIYHSVGIKISFSPMKSAFRASRISPGLSFQIAEGTPAQANFPREPIDSLSTMDQSMGTTNNYFTFIQLHSPYNRDSSYYAFKILEADVSILNYENQLLNNRNLTDYLNSQLDSLQSIRQRIDLDTSNNDVGTTLLLGIEKEIVAVENQLEEALSYRKEIDAELMTSRQNKELFQKAYRLSLERQDDSDSLGFVNKIFEMPDTIRKALTRRGSLYKVDVETAQNPQLPSFSDPMQSRTWAGEEQNFMSFREDEQWGLYSNQQNQTYAELAQERVRNNYLLRELERYSDRYFQSTNQEVDKEEDWSSYSERRNNSGPNIYYRIDDYNRSERGNPNPGYILPLVVPDINNRKSVQSEQDNMSTYIGKAPWKPRISPGLFGFNNRGMSFYFPEVENSRDLNFKDNPEEMSKNPTPNGSAEQNIYSSPINSKTEIYFDNNQSMPSELELMKLQPLATIAKNHPTVEITISGFADNTGRLRHNLNLINERIANVKNFLIEEFGISSQRINILSGGLIVRENIQKPSPSDRKVEVWIQGE